MELMLVSVHLRLSGEGFRLVQPGAKIQGNASTSCNKTLI
jgi:hypothetical protein